MGIPDKVLPQGYDENCFRYPDKVELGFIWRKNLIVDSAVIVEVVG